MDKTKDNEFNNNCRRFKNQSINYFSENVEQIFLNAINQFHFDDSMPLNANCEIFLYLKKTLGLSNKKHLERDQIKTLRNHLIRLKNKQIVNETISNSNVVQSTVREDDNSNIQNNVCDTIPPAIQVAQEFTKYSSDYTLQSTSITTISAVEELNLAKPNVYVEVISHAPMNEIEAQNSPILPHTETIHNKSSNVSPLKSVIELHSDNENFSDDESHSIQGSIAPRNNRNNFIESNFHPNGQTYTLTREEFNKVTDPETKKFKKYNETANARKKTKNFDAKKDIYSFHQLVREVTSCYIYFRATIYRDEAPYQTIIVKASCKYKVCKRFMFKATFLTMGEEDIIFTIFQDLDEINHPYEMCNQARDVSRVLIAEQAISKGSKNVTRAELEALAEHREDLGDNKDLGNLRSDDVYRKVKSEFCLASLRDPDPWVALTKMWIDDDLLAFLDYGPLFVGFICDDQITIILNATDHGKKGLHGALDATGSVFAEPRKDMLFKREKVFMYSLITKIRCNDKDNNLMPFPIFVMFTTCHTTGNIHVMLIKMIDRIKRKTNRELYTIFKTITVDFAMAGINALCLACNMMTLIQYLQSCFNYIDDISKNPNLEIKLVIIRLCTSHVAKILYGLIDDYITDPANKDRLNLRRILSSIHDIRDCNEVYALLARLWKYLIAETPEEKRTMYVALKIYFDNPEVKANEQHSDLFNLVIDVEPDNVDDNYKTIYSQSPFYQRGYKEFKEIIVKKFKSMEEFSCSHSATFKFIITFLRRIVTYLPMLIPTLWYEEFDDLNDEEKKTANRANNGLIEEYHKDVKEDIKKSRIVGTIPIRIDAYADHIYRKDLIPKIIAAKMKIPKNRTSRNVHSAGKITKKRLSKTPTSASRKHNIKDKPLTPKTPQTPRSTKYMSPSIASSISSFNNDKMLISQIKNSKESYGKRSLRWEENGGRKKITMYRKNLLSVNEMEPQFKNNTNKDVKLNIKEPISIGDLSPIAVSTPVSLKRKNLFISQHYKNDPQPNNLQFLSTIEEEISSLDLKPLKLPKPFFPEATNLETDLNNETKPKSNMYDKSTVLMTTAQLEQSARFLGLRTASIISFHGFDTFFENYVYSALPYYTENDPSDCDFLTILVKGKFKLFFGDLKTIWNAPKWTNWFSNYLVEFSLNFLVIHYSIEGKIVPILQTGILFKMVDVTLLPSISNITNEDKKNFVLKYFKHSLIFLPILSNSHFMIAIIDKKKGTFNFFDSFKNRQPDAMRIKLLKNIKEIVDEFKDNLELKKIYMTLVSLSTGSLKINKQIDGCHCGPHVINNAELYMLGKPSLFDKNFNPIEFRQNLLRRLLEFSDDVTNLCPQCGDNRAECTTEKFWLECEKCARWYHSTCVDEHAALLVHWDIRLFVCKICNQCSVFK